jgi:hypothetical protein
LQARWGLHVGLELKEGDATAEESERVALRIVHGVAFRAELVAWLAAKDLGGRVERCPALPYLDDVRIPGVGKCVRSPFAGDEQGVLVEPGDALLAARKVETAFDELACLEIELPLGVGVLSTGGQFHHAEAIAGVQAFQAMGDPAHSIGLAECVKVDDCLPVRRGCVVVRKAGLAEDAVRMGRVAPLVVNLFPAQGRCGQSAGIGGDLEGVGVVGGEARIGLKHLRCAGVVLFHPVHGAGSGDVFKPRIFVGRIGGLLR